LRGRRWRDREWRWFSVTFVLMGLLFTLWPGLDLLIAAGFYVPGVGFAGEHWGWVQLIYQGVPWLGRAVALVALLVAVGWRNGPGRWGVRWWRRWQMLGLALLVGLVLVVHGAAKEHWGRARPHAVVEFGGHARFTPALQPSQQCDTNCSFVSGHAATGFMLAAIGLLGSPATRRRWWLLGALAGFGIGWARMAQGGHFASDVVFSGLLIWGCNLALRGAWLRVCARRRARYAIKGETDA
jgi:lipid A 4'-phosphatase